MMTWPVLMKRKTAAQCCDMTLAEFDKAVFDGELPMPILVAGKQHWAFCEIERRLAIMTGETEKDWRENAPLYNAA